MRLFLAVQRFNPASGEMARSALTSCDQKVFEVVPPSSREVGWTVRRISPPVGSGSASTTTIETGAGPSNVAVFKGSLADVLLAASREEGGRSALHVTDD